MDLDPKDINRLRLDVESKLAEWVKANKSRRHVVTTSTVAKQIGVTTKQIEAYFENIIKMGFYAWLARLRVIDAREVIEPEILSRVLHLSCTIGRWGSRGVCSFCFFP